MKMCCRCLELKEPYSMITIQSEQFFICEDCNQNKVGQVAECDNCGQVKVIAVQDECFRDKQCQECHDKSVQYMKKCEEFYLKCEAKNNK